jgi:hypothetical protein
MEEIAQPLPLEALERIQLDFNKIGKFDIYGDTRITLAG